MPKVTIYTTPVCPYCTLTKEFFKEHGIDYTEIDVSADQEAAREMIKKSGQMGVPVIIVEKDGEENIVIGFAREKLSELLGIDQ